MARDAGMNNILFKLELPPEPGSVSQRVVPLGKSYREKIKIFYTVLTEFH